MFIRVRSIPQRAYALASALALAGCSGGLTAGIPEDPLRAQYLPVCVAHPDQARIEKQSGGRVKASEYCACVFDATMKGLSESEQQVAAFYLLSQLGVSEADLQQFRNMDLDAMGVASAAIGSAVQRCPTR